VCDSLMGCVKGLLDNPSFPSLLVLVGLPSLFGSTIMGGSAEAGLGRVRIVVPWAK
jgi:hypothetical protein